MPKLSKLQQQVVDNFKKNGTRVSEARRKELGKPSESWWIKPDFYQIAKTENSRMKQSQLGQMWHGIAKD